MPKKNVIPRMRRCNGRAFVELAGRRHYLGVPDTPAAQAAYDALIGRWLANGRALPAEGPQDKVTLEVICARFLRHAEVYYVGNDGKSTSQLAFIKAALKTASAMFGSIPAHEFGPIALRQVREQWISEGKAIRTVNGYTAQIKAMYRWAASMQLVDGSTHHALATVEGLRRGRSAAKETAPKKPVALANVEKIKPYVSRQIWAITQLQLFSAARPGEVVALRPCDIDQSGPVWIATPQHHKTEYRGKSRRLYFGSKAQEVLKPFLLRPDDAYLFSPREAEADRHSKAKGHRRPDQMLPKPKTPRKLNEHYTTSSYRKAIRAACEKAGIPRWTPHQIRHTAATQVREEFGLEAAQVILGHSQADVTQIYAERNEALALEVAAKR